MPVGKGKPREIVTSSLQATLYREQLHIDFLMVIAFLFFMFLS
jgi:hypothetical protein